MSIFIEKIDLVNGLIEGCNAKTDKNGYRRCTIKDIYGNLYQIVSDVIYAEGNQLPKHLWPLDENGRKYEVDHIKPIREGGTDALDNLRLVSHKDNCNNERTKKAISDSLKSKYENEHHHMLGKKIAEKTKKKMSDSMQGKLKNDSRISKAVLQYDIEGNLINTFPSTMECERNGFCHTAVIKCCNGTYCNNNKYKNYIWKWAN